MSESQPAEISGHWSAASYGGKEIARGFARGGRFAKEDVRWQYLQPTTTQPTETDLSWTKVGRVKAWDVVVEGKSTLKAAAFELVDPVEGMEPLKGSVRFRAFRSGDSGHAMYPTGEKDGVDLDESWFG